jgi:hypothetical protein
VTLRTRKVRMFKNETRRVPIQVAGGRSRWVDLDSISLRGRPGLRSGIDQVSGGSAELTLTPSLAGTTDSLEAVLKATDPLGLFSKVRALRLEFVLESLPLALKDPPGPLAIPLLAFGENPAGTSGSGQELFAVDRYQPGLDPRDIMWNKVAGMTDDSIPARVREANVRRVISVGIMVGSGSEEEAAERNDLAAEALAKVGMAVFPVRTALEITSSSPAGSRRAVASDARSLADAVTSSIGPGDEPSAIPLPPDSGFDLLIVGPEEVRGTRALILPRSRRILVVSPSPVLGYLPRGTTVFTGREDLGGLASWVIAG